MEARQTVQFVLASEISDTILLLSEQSSGFWLVAIILKDYYYYYVYGTEYGWYHFQVDR